VPVEKVVIHHICVDGMSPRTQHTCITT